ncbi:MAG: hypothetical protein AB1451_16425 [Nitrospirota bacterium]
MPRLTSADLTGLLGKSAAVAYRVILLAQETVKGCTVFKYISPPPLQERVALTDFEKEIVEQALLIRENTKLPFWEAVFSACIRKGQCTDALLKATFFHNGQGLAVVCGRDDLESGVLERLVEGDSANVSLGSEILDRQNESRHLMFLDFHCEVSEGNTRIVHQVCQNLMPEGFLVLDSGDSYHASTIKLVTPKERISMLGKALLASPIVDTTYIGHQLQQESSSIRISKGGKAKRYPVVIGTWCPAN